MIRPCPNVSDCPDDVFGNLSVEDPDPIDYLSIQFASFPPPLINPNGGIWSATECEATFISHTSQLDADMQAAAAAILCAFHTENPGVTPIFNTPSGSTCCVPCPDGLEFCWTVPGIFGALNSAQANAIAQQWACAMAMAHRICLNDLIPATANRGQAYTSNPLIATGAIAPTIWTIESGALPDGILMNGFGEHIFTTSGTSIVLSGTPTVVGTFNFTLRVTGEDGSYIQKPYTLTVKSVATLQAYWTLEELVGTWIDKVAGFVMALPSGDITRVAGKIGEGVQFGGSVFFSSIGGFGSTGPTYAPTTSKGASLWGWFKPITLSGLSIIRMRLGDGSIQNGIEIQFNQGGIGTVDVRFTVYSGGSGYQITAAPAFSAGQWYFVCGTWDKTNAVIKLYVNGVAVSPFLQVVPDIAAIQFVPIITSQIVDATDVIVDEMGVSLTGALTQDQVTALYNATAGVTWPAVKTIVPLA